MPTRYQHGAAGSHGFGTTVPRCIRGISTGLQDLTGKEHLIEHVRSGLQDLTGWELQIVHAYEVLGRGCRFSRLRNTRSYMPTRYQDGAAGSHGFGTTNPTYPEGIRTGLPYRTCREGIRTGLQDLTVRNTRSYTRYQDGIRTELQVLTG